MPRAVVLRVRGGALIAPGGAVIVATLPTVNCILRICNIQRERLTRNSLLCRRASPNHGERKPRAALQRTLVGRSMARAQKEAQTSMARFQRIAQTDGSTRTTVEGPSNCGVAPCRADKPTRKASSTGRPIFLFSARLRVPHRERRSCLNVSRFEI